MQSRLMDNLSERRLEFKYLVLGGLFSAFLLAFSSSQYFATIEDDLIGTLEAAMNAGLVGLFAIAFFSNLAVIVNIPFMLVALPWVVANPTPSGVLMFSLATGIGAGIGKLIAYGLAARVAASFSGLSDSPLHAWISTQIETRPRFAPGLVLLAAGTVLPLDPVLMPLLLVGYPTGKVALPLIVGKVLQSLSLAVVIVLMSAQLGMGGGMNIDLTFGVVLATLLMVSYQVEKARRPAADPALVPVPVS